MAIGLVHDPIFQEHDPGSWHPESPQRLEGIDQVLSTWPGRQDLEPIALRQASQDELARVHSSQHLERIAATAGRAVALDPDTATSPPSYHTALTAAGSLLNLCDAVLDGQVSYGLALLRPPGHHATRQRAMGFCLFNNVAAAAAHLIAQRGLERVMIVDWDVHHGNGTEDIFYTDNRVFYFSTHQSPFYPGSGPVEAVGSGAGSGYNQNVPLAGGHDDVNYVKIFDELMLPLGRLFKPQAILVSAGFDAHQQDPLGGMMLSEAGFATMTNILTELSQEFCPGRMVFALEGGYSPSAMGRSVVAVLEALGGKNSTSLREQAAQAPPFRQLINAKKVAAFHWQVG